MKAIVKNKERLLYNETVEIIAKKVIYIDQDNEQYTEDELKFIK